MDARITFTPNLKLTKLPANFHVWSQIMNDNLTLLDAAVSGFIVYQNMRGPWTNSTAYAVGDTVVDADSAVVWQCHVANTSSTIPTTFLDERTAHPTYWAVYSTAATARGVWTGPGTAYALNDFVVADGTKFAICIFAHVSSATFSADVALGRWGVLVDLSTAGSLVLPVLGGGADADKNVMVDSLGSAYGIFTADVSLTKLGATAIGKSLFRAIDQSTARTAIDAAQSTDTTTQTPGNNSTRYASTGFVAEALSHYTPTSSTMRLYDEQILAGTATEIRVAIPANAKKVEIEFFIGNNVAADFTLVVQAMQGAAAYAGATYSAQALSTSGATVVGSFSGGATLWSYGVAQSFTGMASLRYISTGWYGNMEEYAINFAGTVFKYGISQRVDVTANTITGFRLTSSTGTVNFAVGSFVRSFVIA